MRRSIVSIHYSSEMKPEKPQFSPATSATVLFKALSGTPLVRPGDDLTEIILTALQTSGERLQDGDVLIIAQKIVSKAEGQIVALEAVKPSAAAEQLATAINKDPRLVELILSESNEVVRLRRDVLVVEHRSGLVMANAGIDQSNVVQDNPNSMALLLPKDPDGTCDALRTSLRERTGTDVAVIINDSHGRAFRNGVVGVAIGVSGITALSDLRGVPDLFGRQLKSTDVALADEIASAASLVMGQSGEGRPIVLARGIASSRGDGRVADLIRPKPLDLFRTVTPSEVHDVLRQRRSVRRYAAKSVASELIHRILTTATHAPSAHNRQPWRFAVLAAAAPKVRLARAMAERLREDRTRDGADAAAIEQDTSRSIARITGAPVVVLVCMTMDDMDIYPDDRRTKAEHQMAVQSTAMAVQNLLIAAHAEGLGTSVMCAPLFCPDVVRAALGLPESFEPQALVTLGFPVGFAAAEGKPRQRRPLDDLVKFIEH